MKRISVTLVEKQENRLPGRMGPTRKVDRVASYVWRRVLLLAQLDLFSRIG
jgi:hypothetical protein